MKNGMSTAKAALRLFIAAATLAFALAGCGGGGGAAAPAGAPTGGGGTTTTVTLLAISVTPSFPASLPKGLTQQFTATGLYSDGTSQNITAAATWSSTATTVASVNTSGLATGVGVGTANINASSGGITSSSVALTVSPALLQSIAITPVTPTIGAGQSIPFTAIGTYSDNSTQNISSYFMWSSSNLAVATVNSSNAPNVAYGFTPGTVTITAAYGGVTSSTTLTVANYSVGGVLSGLPAGGSVAIQNNLADTITLSTNGAFMFPAPLASGSSYSVSVSAQPGVPAHPCTVVDGGGTIATNYISFVQVVCGPAVGTFAGGLKINLINNLTAIWPLAGGFVNGTGTVAQFNGPAGSAYDSLGNLYVADSGNNAIRKITPAGVVTTFAGSGAAGFANNTNPLLATFNWPQGVAVDSSNNVYVADTNNNAIRKITQAGVVTTVAGSGVAGATNSANPLTATFNLPRGVAVDASGNMYVADTLNSLIRKIASTGAVTTLAGNGISTLTNGIGTAASFYYPDGVLVDKTNTYLYVADTYNNAIRGIVLSTASVYTVAGLGVFSGGSINGSTATATFSWPTNVAIDASNNIYVADGSSLIRKIVGSYSAGVYTGTVSTLTGLGGVNSFADGPASSSLLAPIGIAVDASNNLFISDVYNLIRKYTP